MTSVDGERDGHTTEVESRETNAYRIPASEVREEPAASPEERRRNQGRSDRRESFRLGGRRAEDL